MLLLLLLFSYMFSIPPVVHRIRNGKSHTLIYEFQSLAIYVIANSLFSKV